MKTLALGNTGERVSALCLGAMNFGTKLSEAESMAILDRYYEAGGRFLDTANNYAVWWGGDGTESENVLGRWMRDRGTRDEMFVATKVGFNTPKVGNSLSKQIINQEIEGSLKRLGTDRIELYYAHKDHREDPLEETLSAFDTLHRAGKLRFIGCSNYRAWRIEEAHNLSKRNGWISYCCVQQRHTYLRPVPGASFGPQLAVDDELIDFGASRKDRFLLLGYSSTLGGAFTGRPDRPIPSQYQGKDSDERLATLTRIAREIGATPVQVVYAWMLQSEPPVLPLVSAGSVEQLDENLRSGDIALSDAQLAALNNAGNPPAS